MYLSSFTYNQTVPADLLTNMTATTGSISTSNLTFSATNKIFNGKRLNEKIYFVIQAIDNDPIMKNYAKTDRFSKPLVVKFRIRLDPRVYLLGQDSVSIIQYQSYVDRYVHIVDPLSDQSEFKKYNNNLAVTVSANSRISWNPLPETNTTIQDLANSATGTKYINYVYTPSPADGRPVEYREFNGTEQNSAHGAKLQRQVTVVSANTNR